MQRAECEEQLDWTGIAGVVSSGLAWAGNDIQASTAPEWPVYQPVAEIQGTLSSVGSDTFANLMTYWSEAFRHLYPQVNIQVQAIGSSAAPTALTEATAQLGPMSRPMKTKEIAAFEQNYGYKPTPVRVAIDALAVFVHEDNPLPGLRFQQIDAMFSRTLRCGGNRQITHWGQLGLTGRWAMRDIQRFGRNSVSGTYGYFKQKALCNGDFRNDVNEQPGSASVVQSVSTSLNAIGYSGIGYRTTGIRAIPVAQGDGPFVAATHENVANGSYPLARYLYIYINQVPGKPLPKLQAEFLRFVLSAQGQQLVDKDGYVPLPPAVLARELAALGLTPAH
ncbi:phosphate ABC transporter substrate-binding protein PstS family protein [Photobacterium sp. GJ3]|uniref:PstS family phosphate ABC transporter substrate-binding protein n=1 Tax=Photobacterium sp. GJ3 TaxID=2829502 RepID=UPI001B8B5CAB|nr:phosphate ABC transporter substrate-binding protein PstS family protein [Photobacterium sp. GJ3]QUJ68099.1 phosphate ABC transporter substrate-binding protein PstS family protein [Photobacterium sp. GJ3]